MGRGGGFIPCILSGVQSCYIFVVVKINYFLYDMCKYSNMSYQYHTKGNYELVVVNLNEDLVLVKVNDTNKAYDG